MPVLNVAFCGSADLARSLAKSNDVRDIESYVFKEKRNGETSVLSLLRPLRHPERLRPLLSVLNVAKVGVVEVRAVDAAMGEVLVAFGAARISRGIVIINPDAGGWVDPDQVRMILKQAGLESWALHETLPDAHDLREEIFSHIEAAGEAGTEGALVLPVDQYFNVKGVGLVAIGYVQDGAVKKHDEVLILPANERAVVRSLQVMDDDVEAAVSGDRVGLALRNLREEALHRGCIIVHPNSDAPIRHDKSNLVLERTPFQKRQVALDDVIHAAVDLQFVVGRVTAVEGDSITVEWENPLWIRSIGSPSILITQLDAMPMRIMGCVERIEVA